MLKSAGVPRVGRRSANHGVFVPPAMPREEPPSQCCARCRRGIKEFGVLPCGYDGECKCHKKKEGN